MNQHIFRVDVDTVNVDKNYLHYAINAKLGVIINQARGGVGLKHITKGKLEAVEIPFPQLAEQKRIAAILDKADNLRRKRQQAIQLADQFLRSVFLDLFGDPITNSKGWEVRKWVEVLTIINGKSQRKVESVNGIYPIYGSGGEMGRADSYLCKENTVVIGRKGNINKPLLVKEKYWNVDTAFGLEVNPELMAYQYFYWFCRFFNFERLNKAVTIPSLTKSDLYQIEIPIPPMNPQLKFVMVFDAISALRSKQQGGLMENKHCFNAVSQKAFVGVL